MSQYITVCQQPSRTPRSLPGDYRISRGDSSGLSLGLCSSQLPSFSSSKPVADPEPEEGCLNLVMLSNLYLSQHTVSAYLKNCIHILKSHYLKPVINQKQMMEIFFLVVVDKAWSLFHQGSVSLGVSSAGTTDTVCRQLHHYQQEPWCVCGGGGFLV